MWIPKDERKTLLKYYHYLQNTQEYKRFNSPSDRVCNATHNLIERGLIYEITEGGQQHNEYLTVYLVGNEVSLAGFLPSSEENDSRKSITLQLTLAGLDLARKYDNWFIRTGLWWAEYKYHWFWIILSYIAGVISTPLVNWLKKLLVK